VRDDALGRRAECRRDDVAPPAATLETHSATGLCGHLAFDVK
jgi:hypothetical protein